MENYKESTRPRIYRKKLNTESLEDLLVQTTKWLCNIIIAIRKEGGIIDTSTNHNVTFNLFSTISNANSNKEVFYRRIEYTTDLNQRLAERVKNKSLILSEALWKPKNREEIDNKAIEITAKEKKNDDISSLKDTIIYGLKGLSYYMNHANMLKYEDEEIDIFIQKALNTNLKNNISANELLELVLKTGKYGIDAMSLFKKANTTTYEDTDNIICEFANNQVLELREKIAEAVKDGTIKKFIVLGGCEGGRDKERDYDIQLAKKLPKNTVILTASCTKYRYHKLNLGDINGIPRVLDSGQCGDSYALVTVALALKEILGLKDTKDLPIVYDIPLYEQKSFIILLSLLSLGIKNIHLGPNTAEFIPKNVIDILIKKFTLSNTKNINDDFNKFNLIA